MIIRKVNDVPAEPVTEPGAAQVTRRILLSPCEAAPNFTMRRFEVAPGGFTMFHQHNYEHEIYILSGRGKVRRKDSEIEIAPHDAILVLPNEEHQFINIGDEPLVFLCLIPNI
ncbi:MAG: cupin domain-containing protein [Candidatus Marinimicrobia bacterium]|jgi:quercetin dioxygenase-like cupin family protein|nr:cupin domain-containing protein [Candidatus Neomarinimicrobiota bacterium]MCK9558952.1 cupin domain-containing protein [Candidatus Neomarinimicrobiota bacterium]MDD5060984.1 cupin domain-containing protein [Candidatus Neomarinimicrobiota bacterium]MDD5539251.1 cupin domain-containing protein [Candidatus Neomarinimicrobiota bacterium]